MQVLNDLVYNCYCNDNCYRYYRYYRYYCHYFLIMSDCLL